MMFVLLLSLLFSLVSAQESRRFLVLSKHKSEDEALTSMTDIQGNVVWKNAATDGLEFVHVMEGTHEQVNLMSKRAEVFLVEEDMPMHLNAPIMFQQSNNTIANETEVNSWALDRIDQRSDDLDKSYAFLKYQSGVNVTVFVLDTGVNVTLDEFEGRAFDSDFMIEPPSNQKADQDTSNPRRKLDPSEHGTFVASLVASKTYGAAKNATIVSVKVLDDHGKGSVSDLIKGLFWVSRNATELEKKIVNVSAGAPRSRILNRVVDLMTRRGFIIVVAAGNEAEDACDYSPSSARRAFSVAASARNDSLAYFSNYGRCVSLFAPGANVTGMDGSGKEVIASGTSFSSPLVAGVLAQYWSYWNDQNSSFVSRKLMEQTTNDTIAGLNGTGIEDTPNRLVYSLPMDP